MFILSKKTDAFTLFEVIMVVAIIGVVLTVTAPIGIQFYQNNMVTGMQSQMMESLRKANSRAVRSLNDSDHGIYMATSTDSVYYIFQGSSWDGRVTEYDEPYDVSPGVSIEFPGASTTILFSKKTGIPVDVNNNLATGTIRISKDGAVRTITINEFGIVNTP